MRRLLAVLLLGLLAACAGKNQIVLLPNEDGSPSAVTISNATGTTVLDQPGSAVNVARPSSTPERITLNDADIQKVWGDADRLQLGCCLEDATRNADGMQLEAERQTADAGADDDDLVRAVGRRGHRLRARLLLRASLQRCGKASIHLASPFRHADFQRTVTSTRRLRGS
jgi:hypothetical protein